ncbi:hypothetical protein VHA_001297 [Grimontia hollisae CIP 101886]|uniref:Uncharacterized protein n=1 Tax=Grimontia hollisae CIP 101886 TaxID=675812 RepID=D0I6D0_GRIHO|nr:hypothetical protein VHA_001297 [Grimontia hollisae CIP 101886]
MNQTEALFIQPAFSVRYDSLLCLAVPELFENNCVSGDTR